MKNIVLGVFLILVASRAAALDHVRLTTGTPEQCSSVLNAVTNGMALQILDVPGALDAGQPLTFTLLAQKTFSLNADDWDMDASFVMISMSTEMPYPKSLEFGSTPSLTDFVFGGGSSGQFTIRRDLSTNIDATFGLNFKFVGFRKRQGYCIIDGDFEKQIVVHSTMPDMFPPLVRGIAFDKQSYRPGEEVLLRIRLTESLGKPETDHLEFLNPELPEGDQGRGFPGYLPDGVYSLNLIGAGEYSVRFTVPVETKPGKYYFEWFNRSDIFGNFEASLGAVDLIEKQVVSGTPLMVE